MAETFSQEAVLDFLLRHRGKVRNVDLTAHFRHFLRDSEQQLQNRELFKKFVNSLAVVKVEDGVKYISLRKRYTEFIPGEFSSPSDRELGHPTEGVKAKQRAGKCNPPVDGPPCELGAEVRSGTSKGRGATGQSPRGSAGEVSGVQRRVAQAPKASLQQRQSGKRADEANRSPLEAATAGGKKAGGDRPVRRKDRTTAKARDARASKANKVPAADVLCAGDATRLLDGAHDGNLDQPVSASSPASPLFSHATPPVAKYKEAKPAQKELPTYDAEITARKPGPETEWAAGKSDQSSLGDFLQVNASRKTEGIAPTRDTKLNSLCRSSLENHGNQAKVPQNSVIPEAARSEENHPPNQGELSCRPLAGNRQFMGISWHSEGESTSPKKRASLIKVSKSNELSNKELSLSGVDHNPTVMKIIDGDTPLNIRARTPNGGEHLKTEETSEESSLVPLDPKEHQWIVKTAAGMFEQACDLFGEDPTFGMKKDFISGYTVLHWIAKHGNHVALLRFIRCARKSKIKLNVDIKSTCGYTPLHIATMYGQFKVIQYLVNKYHANFNLRDHSGKKPWQYLNNNAPEDVFLMLGAPEHKQAKPQGSSTFSTKDISRQKLSNAVSRKTSFSALLKSPQLMKKFMHLDSDHLHAISEEDEKTEDK
ncbi:ankyrin repeat domain-containing protein SOWAHB-like [Narcine bancroftii]|uniref:ankyrin repeat domain-containing protein SOWAHB-like n=1 Tax=Narcine bancroftii TaxID=1343680 RepID=UPI003831A324